jgi:hypothetical protein
VNGATHGAVCATSKQPELNGASVRLEPVTPGEKDETRELQKIESTGGKA